MSFESTKEWFLGLGTNYGVNPFIFGAIYVGAIPFFLASMAWLIKNIKDRKSVILPVISTGFFFISAYLYLIIAGRNVPWWVYVFVIALIAFSGWSTYNKIKSQAKGKPVEPETSAGA
jgi:hypothetical protein